MNLVNIGKDGRCIYLFKRDQSGKLHIEKDEHFYPYYYEVINNEEDADAKGYYGANLKKTFVSHPREIRKQRSSQAHEADIKYPKRYLIDKVDNIDKTTIKWAIFDIEIYQKKDVFPNPMYADRPISCITIYNSLREEYKTWFLGEEENEEILIQKFLRYLKQEKFDIMMAWNLEYFDYPYLQNRIDRFGDEISPVGCSRYGIKYKDKPLWYPVGASMIDYMVWDKKITLNRKKSYALDARLQEELGYGKEHKDVDFSTLNPVIKERNIEDVKKMVEFEKQKNYIGYYDAIRRMAKCEWEDLTRNSRMIDMLALAEAKKKNIALPSCNYDNDRADFKGAFRRAFATGRFQNITSYDLSSAYPNMLKDFNLDPSNISEDEGIEIFKGVKFKQDNTAILPTIADKLLNLKSKIKKELKTASEEDYEDTKIRYKAIKALVNSCFTPDTKIFTENGIKNIKNVKIGETVYNVNPKTLKVEKDKVVAKQKLNYNGPLYNYKTRTMDLATTADHKFLVKSQKGKIKFREIHQIAKNNRCNNTIPKINNYKVSPNNNYITFLKTLQEKDGKIWARLPKENMYKLRFKKILNFKQIKRTKKIGNKKYHNWRKCEAKNITQKQLLKLHKNGWKLYGQISSKTKISPIIFDKKTFLKFLGWFISEGSTYKSKIKNYKTTTRGEYYKISISQKKNKKFINDIIKVINNMNFYLNNKINNYSFCSEIMYYYLREYCGVGSHNKKIPHWIYSEPYSNRKIFVDTLYKGDGNKNIYRYNSASKQLTEDLALLQVLNGNNSISIKKDSGVYRMIAYNAGRKMGKENIDVKNYKGTVYCVTTERNHTVFAGRNGTFTLTGQCYGYTGFPFARLYDKRVAETITYLPRNLMEYVITHLEEEGYEVIYADTDGIMVDTKENITNKFNKYVKQWAQEKFGKGDVSTSFDYEGKYTDIIILGRCRYHGYKEEGGDTKEVKVGLEIKRKDSTDFIVGFQTELLNKIHNGCSKIEVDKWVDKQKKKIKQVPLEEISFPCKLSKKIKDYKSNSIWVRALEYAQKYGFDVRVGEPYYYVYIKPFAHEENIEKQLFYGKRKLTPSMLKDDWEQIYGEEVLVKDMKDEKKEELIQTLKRQGKIVEKKVKVKGTSKNVMAFGKDYKKHMKNFEIDWKMQIRRNIQLKVDNVYEAMGWK